MDLAIAKRLICVTLQQLLKSLRFASSFFWWFDFFPQPPAAKVIAKKPKLGENDYGRFSWRWAKPFDVSAQKLDQISGFPSIPFCAILRLQNELCLSQTVIIFVYQQQTDCRQESHGRFAVSSRCTPR